MAWEIPQLQIAGCPAAKSGLESLELALFLFSFLRICYWPLSLLDSFRKKMALSLKNNFPRAFLGREPNTQAGGGANAGWLCLTVPSQATKKPLKITKSFLLQPPPGSLYEHPGLGRGCDPVVSLQKQSTSPDLSRKVWRPQKRF